MGLDSPLNTQAQVKLEGPVDRQLQDPLAAMKNLATRPQLAAKTEGKTEAATVVDQDSVNQYGGTVSVDAQGTKTTSYKDGVISVERTNHTGYTLTPKSDGTFFKHSWAPAAAHFWLPNQNKDERLTASQVLDQKKDALLPDSKQYIKDPAELKTFQENMQRFEQRAQKEGMGSAQVAQTYQQVDSLLTSVANGNTNNEQRIALAEQIINQAAAPNQIRQGNNNTCGPASIESAAYLRHPDQAARLVADTALTGKYVSLDGVVVKVDPTPQGQSLTAGGDKVERNPGADQRSYASQLFQVTALNEIMQASPYRKGSRYYVDRDGEHADLLCRGSDGRITTKKYAFIGTDSASLTQAYQAITGDGNLKAISHNDYAARTISGPSPVVRSEDDLNQVLATAQMPAVILLNADNAPLDQPAYDGKGHYLDGNERGHFCHCFFLYGRSQPQSGNSQTPQGEGFPYGQGGEISVHDLHLATLPRKEEIAGLQQDVQMQRQVRSRTLPITEL